MFDSKLIDGIDHFQSYAKKKSNDFEWYKKAHKYYDMHMRKSMQETEMGILKEHLAAGEMPNLNDPQLSRLGIKMYGQQAKRDFNLVPHFPLIDTVYEKMKGIRQRMNFEPQATDLSIFSKNQKSQEHLRRLQEYLDYDYGKFKEQLTQQYLMEYGVADVAEMSHEDQQDMQAEIEARFKKMTPERINEYFDKEYFSPFSEMSQAILDYESDKNNLKKHFEDRFSYAYKDNMEVSYIYETHGIPRIAKWDPKYFYWWGDDMTDTIEDGERCKAETWRTPMQLFDLYGEYIKDKDIEKIKPGMFNIGLNGDINVLNGVEETLAISYYADNYKDDKDRVLHIDQRTEEGQQKLMAYKARFYGGNMGSSLIRDCHITFKTPIDMYCVKRIEGDRIEYSWRHTDYERNPDIDIEVRKIKSVQIGQARCIGDPLAELYIQAGPLGYDWADIGDPRSRKHPYCGGLHGSVIKGRGGNRRKGLFDKGIPSQIKINIEAARLEEEKGFNLGKVFVMLSEARGDDVTPEQFFDTMKGSRLIDLDGSKINGVFASSLAQSGRVFNSVDMSNNVAIKESWEEIEGLYNHMKRNMGVDDMDVNPYATDANLKVGQENATNATLDLFTKHIYYMNNTLQMYIDFCHHVYKKNPKQLEWILNDMSYQLLLSGDYLKYAKPGVFIKNNIQDQLDLREAKMEIMHFVQNGAYTMIPDYMRLKLAKNMAGILNASEGMARKGERQQEDMMQAQQEQAKMAAQMRDKELQDARQHEKDMQQQDALVDIEREAIRAEQWLNTSDVNKNNQNDLNENAQKQREFDMDENEKDRRLKLEIEKIKQETMRKKATLTQKSKKKTKK